MGLKAEGNVNNSDLYHSLEIASEYAKHVASVLRQEGLSPIKKFSTGHTGNTVLLTSNKQAENIVIKIPNNDTSQQEIFNNLDGYDRIRKEDITQILPNHIQTGFLGGFTYLMTTYLGEDFAAQTATEERPEKLYDDLSTLLLSLYKTTVKRDGQSSLFLNMIEQRLHKNFEKYIIPAGLADSNIVSSLLQFNRASLETELSCFGVFDFTPEDIYLQPHTIKYPDPKGMVRGNPIVDLACFSGVSHEVHNLPGSQYGYLVLERFATSQVSQLLNLSTENAQRIFYLGRSLQCSLSSRFRTTTEPDLAYQYAQESLDFLRKIQ